MSPAVVFASRNSAILRTTFSMPVAAKISTAPPRSVSTLICGPDPVAVTLPAVVSRTSKGSSSSSITPESSASKASRPAGAVRSELRPASRPVNTTWFASECVLRMIFLALSIPINPSFVTARCNTRLPEPIAVRFISPTLATTASRIPTFN